MRILRILAFVYFIRLVFSVGLNIVQEVKEINNGITCVILQVMKLSNDKCPFKRFHKIPAGYLQKIHKLLPTYGYLS